MRWKPDPTFHASLRGHRHLHNGGMRDGPRQLMMWSFLMATAHGAGLIVLPLVTAIITPLL